MHEPCIECGSTEEPLTTLLPDPTKDEIPAYKETICTGCGSVLDEE